MVERLFSQAKSLLLEILSNDILINFVEFKSTPEYIHFLFFSLYLKKENVDLYPCPWGHNIYMDAYF